MALGVLIGVAGVPAVAARTPPSARGGVPLMRFCRALHPCLVSPKGGAWSAQGPAPPLPPSPNGREGSLGRRVAVLLIDVVGSNTPTHDCLFAVTWRVLACRPCWTIPTEGLSPSVRVDGACRK